MSDALLDVLTLVSSDKRFPLEVATLMTAGEVRVVHTFRTGSECLRALSLDDGNVRRVILVDSLISDISPANLCDAIRVSYPALSVVMVVSQNDAEGIGRAMLAGAKATISRQANIDELRRVLERVVEVSTHGSGIGTGFGGTVGAHGQMAAGLADGDYEGGVSAGGYASHVPDYAGYGDYGRRAVLVPFIGARGGAGRSTLSSALAYLAAEARIDTALIDFDLQFGDLSFLFGSSTDDDMLGFLEEAGRSYRGGSGSSGQSTLRNHESLRRFGKQVTPNLRLYALRALPEKTELLSKYLPDALERLRAEHELLIVNTGAYWTLFHTELLEQSDLSVCVLDQSIVGIRASSDLQKMCHRLGVPTSRLLFVMNKALHSGLSARDVSEVLQAERVFCVHNAGSELTQIFDDGDFSRLLQQGSFMAELYQILDEIAVRTDLCVHDAVSMRYSMRRESKGRKGLLRRA